MAKRVFVTLLLSLLACLSSMAATSLDEAKEMVEKYVSDSLNSPTNCVVFLAKEDLRQVEMHFRETVEVPASVWTFFIDPAVGVSLVHDAKIVFVSKTTGKISVVNVDMSPKNIREWTVVYDPSRLYSKKVFDDGNNSAGALVGPVVDGIAYDSEYRNAGGVFDTKLKDSPDSYAVIISGGWDSSNNWIRYWNDCSFVYQLLVDQYGYKKENIYIIMASGNTTAWDFSMTATMLAVSNNDLDNDGEDETILSATRDNIESVFDELSGKITDKNDLFVFTIDHGDRNGSLCLWDYDMMSPYEFAEQIDKVSSAKSMSFVLGQCYSGSFVEVLKGPGRTIATSANANEMSLSSPCMKSPYLNIRLYCSFVYHWTMSHRNGAGDYDGDGEVSMLEAFNYAVEHDIYAGEGYVEDEILYLEHPQYWSDFCIGERQYLGRASERGYEAIIHSNPINEGNVVMYANDFIDSRSVISGGDVEFNAGRSVVLSAPFTVKNGAKFKARIVGYCDGSDNIVDPTPNIYMSGNNGNGINGALTDLEFSQSETASSIYPNPTTGLLNIRVAGDAVINNISVMDITGKVLLTENASSNASSNASEINMSSLAKGVYFVKVVTNEDSYVEKVVLK